jgi:hypothetical protein
MFTFKDYIGMSPESLVHLDGGLGEHDCENGMSDDRLVAQENKFFGSNQIRNGAQSTIINVGINLEIAELILVTPHTIGTKLHCQPHCHPTRCFSSSFIR